MEIRYKKPDNEIPCLYLYSKYDEQDDEKDNNKPDEYNYQQCAVKQCSKLKMSSEFSLKETYFSVTV